MRRGVGFFVSLGSVRAEAGVPCRAGNVALHAVEPWYVCVTECVASSVAHQLKPSMQAKGLTMPREVL